MMQAIVLCGGKGTRLSDLYADRPKILAPVAGRAFIEWQIEWFVRGGVTDVHLAGGYMADVLRDWLKAHCINAPADDSDYQVRVAGSDVRVSLSQETLPLGTGGGLKFVEPFVRAAPFFVVNGDSLMPNLDFAAMTDAHALNSEGITLAVTRIEESGRYGTVEFDESLRVTAFREKAIRSDGWINGGVYLMSRPLLVDVQPGKAVSIETEVFPVLTAKGRLQAFTAPAPLLDMGTPEGILAMERYLRGA